MTTTKAEAKPNRKALHAALDSVDKAADQLADRHPAKADQLRAHLATCHMVVDELFDTVPAPTSTD
jgi:ABC-type transporter Mla subunit MlaD